VSGSPQPLWRPTPERVAQANLTAFQARVERRLGRRFADYEALHRWSVDDLAGFWREVWDFCGIVHRGEIRRVMSEPRMPGASGFERVWFEGVKLNYAENLLQGRGERPALIAECEDEGLRREISFGELRRLVARAAAGLKRLGVGRGDRVAALAPNIPEAVVAMLAAASIGAVWSSCSPDFGLQGILDRFGQIEPRLLLSADGYVYGGKRFSLRERLEGALAALPGLEHVVVVPFLGPPIEGLRCQLAWDDFLGPPDAPLEFEALPFDHPLFILYTSGTTGVPKCIVHGHGGTLLKHREEHSLQVDLKAGDVFFYFTTCGWMMWNWLASGLGSGAALVLYDGSPLAPDARRLLRLIERDRISIFGTSPRYLSALEKAGIEPRREASLDSLRTLISTGSPLNPAQFAWVYRAFPPDLHLTSISGGTDLIGCFVAGAPTLPVYAGEIQCRALGMKVESVDEEGRAWIGRKGELVCSAPFPSLPLGFWNDPGGRRFHAAYFERYPGRWHHGDFIEITERGSAVIYGRSDATLNPGGVRIGTAEIYRQVESVPEVLDALAVARERDGDVDVLLFVVLAPGKALDADLEARMRRVIREGASPRHVPREIHAVPEVPRTISGKTVELAVAALLRGEEVPNRDALANPEALEYFRRFAKR
jgi:acetoacetyl-CoA synthetase